MNIEIANRLFELRKQMNLSQEELSEKIGVSRQAISKWERAESSPDTDNLIVLARLYGISLDKLLFTTEALENKGAGGTEDGNPNTETSDKKTKGKDFAANIHQFWGKAQDGIRTQILTRLPIALIITGVYLFLGLVFNLWHPTWILFLLIPAYYQIVSMTKAHETVKKLNRFPIVFVCLIFYLLTGFLLGWWHPTWIVFLCIPIYYSMVNAVFKPTN
jgi:transcriptional regulator with XRE-family HTH domain